MFHHPAPAGPRAALGTLMLYFLLATAVMAQPPAPGFAPTGDGPEYPPLANGTVTAVPALEAFNLGGMTIKVDGRLDDEAWNLAQSGWGWQQNEPSRGGPPSVPSTFKVAYDQDALYIGVACWEDDMANVSSHLNRRDDIQASDQVSLYLDPYLDRTTGYNFRVNPEGVQADAYLFDNGNRDWDWNAVWQAEVTSDDRGWYVEIRIPFSQVRFRPAENMTWGMQIYRWMHGRAEDTGWVTWDRNSSGFVSRWGNLTGLRGVDNPRKLEILPYVVTKHTDPADPDCATDHWQNSQNFGADLKYGITSNLTLNATIQPDFGQVEADPAVLNLSPFETFYRENRPFFVEGARSFQHPDFNLFYSRRIGTGDPNSRIRAAAKLTGKIGGDFSVAVLGAATDLGVPGKTHNPFIGGTQKTYYGLIRLGKEFAEGSHQVNLMGTAVKRDKNSFSADDGGRRLRDGYSGGLDFELNFDDRNYQISGSAVGTIVDSFTDHFDPLAESATRYGTAGDLEFEKNGGNWRGELSGRWESDELDPNDMGFLSAPDEILMYGNVEYHYDSEGSGAFLKSLRSELESYRSWFYAGNTGIDRNSGRQAWGYDRGHEQSTGIHWITDFTHRDYHNGWIFAGVAFDRSSKYATRTFEGERGPLMTEPGWVNIAGGLGSDWRKPFSLNWEVHWDGGDNLDALATNGSIRWNQNEHLTHHLGLGIRHNRIDSQWVENFANDGSRQAVPGLGGVDYVFGELDQVIWDVTLRSSVLFDRNKSLQLYLQPFLTRGRYSNPKWLATADSYDLRPYPLDAGQYDFNYGAVNLNLVYRWEYRPGSTLFLVWTHNKERFDRRMWSADPDAWTNGFEAGYPFGTEPGNTLLAKFSYWFSI